MFQYLSEVFTILNEELQKNDEWKAKKFQYLSEVFTILNISKQIF